MDYERKYRKYKTKYMMIKYGKLVGGGDYETLYHGTSFFYIDHIVKHGLDGEYPDDIFQFIEKYWDKIRDYFVSNKINHKGITYVPGFIKKNRAMKDTGEISISFTPNIDIAKEYAGGERVLGEGPGYFAQMLNEYINNNIKSHESTDEDTELKTMNKKLQDGRKMPGIILAIKPNELDITTQYDAGDFEVVIRTKISPEYIYIYEEEFKLIKLTSDDGRSYIKDKMEKNIKEQTERKTEEEKYLQEIQKWKETETESPSRFVISNIKIFNNKYKVNIDCSYDQYVINEINSIMKSWKQGFYNLNETIITISQLVTIIQQINEDKLPENVELPEGFRELAHQQLNNLLKLDFLSFLQLTITIYDMDNRDIYNYSGIVKQKINKYESKTMTNEGTIPENIKKEIIDKASGTVNKIISKRKLDNYKEYVNNLKIFSKN